MTLHLDYFSVCSDSSELGDSSESSDSSDCRDSSNFSIYLVLVVNTSSFSSAKASGEI